MNKKQQFLFYFSPAIIFFANDFVRSYLRPIYGFRKYGLFSNILGWLPNYFAGLGFVLLGLISFRFIIEITKHKNYYKYYYNYMNLITVLSAVGLIWWEFEQKNGKLIYDKNDINATIVGVLSGYLIFLILMFRNLLDTKDNINNEVEKLKS
jgi:hypothetical protein